MIEMTVDTKKVIGNISKFGGGFFKHLDSVMKESILILEDDIKKSASLTDHTIKQIAEAGHPYAKRHSQTSTARAFHDPFWKVHKQSGALYNAIESETKKAQFIGAGEIEISGQVGIDEGKAEHGAHIIYGTKKMIARDFLSETLKATTEKQEKLWEKGIRDGIIKEGKQQ